MDNAVAIGHRSIATGVSCLAYGPVEDIRIGVPLDMTPCSNNYCVAQHTYYNNISHCIDGHARSNDPFQIAIANKHWTALYDAIKNKELLLDRVHRDGNTAVLYAIKERWTTGVLMLLRAGAYLDISTPGLDYICGDYPSFDIVHYHHATVSAFVREKICRLRIPKLFVLLNHYATNVRKSYLLEIETIAAVLGFKKTTKEEMLALIRAKLLIMKWTGLPGNDF